MRDDEYSPALVEQGAYRGEQALHAGRVQAQRRLVEDHKSRVHGKHAGERDSALLSPRKQMRVELPEHRRVQTHSRQGRLCLCPGILHVTALSQGAEHNVVENRRPEQLVLDTLKSYAHIAGAHVLAIAHYDPRLGLEQPRRKARTRGLARARISHKGNEFALIDAQRDTSQTLFLAIVCIGAIAERQARTGVGCRCRRTLGAPCIRQGNRAFTATTAHAKSAHESRVAHKCCGHTPPCYFPLTHRHEPVELENVLKVVRHLDNAHVGLTRTQRCLDGPYRPVVQHAEGLVKQQNARPQSQGARNARQLFLAARQLRDVPARELLYAAVLQSVPNAGLNLPWRKAKVAQAEGDLVKHGRAHETGLRVLRHIGKVREVLAPPLPRIHGHERRARHTASRWLPLPRISTHGRRLQRIAWR